jgi:geranylgeranyl reductase family protein
MLRVDVLVVGAGPAGCCAARHSADDGASVLVVEKRRSVGLPVQCAEYVPAQIASYVAPTERAIAQRIRGLRTHLPDGEVVHTRAPGYVLDRALFDKGLAVTASRAGARIWTSVRAVERADNAVIVQRAGQTVTVEATVIIGADGPGSTVGGWIGQSNTAFVDALQVEVVLREPLDDTEVYFAPQYAGGYGWLFPKGETANVGVGLSRLLGGDAQAALDHLLGRLSIADDAVVSRTGGPVPCGGSLDRIRAGNVLLVGDAGGHTHAVTGAGILSAVVSGTLAGQAAAAAIRESNLAALEQYDAEWSAHMAGPLRHALAKRRTLDAQWTSDADSLTEAVRENWIAFRAYSRR